MMVEGKLELPLLHGSALLAFLAGTAVASGAPGRFDGWCFMDDVCYGPSVIFEDTFGWCEGGCSMTEPTRVRDMQAMLYWVECDGGDSAIPFEYRLLLSPYGDEAGGERLVAVTNAGVQELTRCAED